MTQSFVSPIVRRKDAIIPPAFTKEQEVPMQSYTEELREKNAARSEESPKMNSNQVGRKGLDAATQKKIYDMSVEGKTATEIKNALGISYITAGKYMSAKIARGEKVKPKMPVKQVAVKRPQPVVVPEAVIQTKEVDQLSMAINVLKLARQWGVPLSAVCEAATVAQRIEDAVK